MFTNIQTQQQKQDMTNVSNAIRNIFSIQQQPEFQHLIQIQQQFYLCFNNQLNKTIHQPVGLNSSTFDSLRHQSQRIILKNQKLKEQIMLIKTRLEQLLNFSDTFNPSQKFQELQNIEKAKLFSTQIKAKILVLKQKRYINKEGLMSEQDQAISQHQRRVRQKVAPLQLQIEEMKKGAEFMSRQLVSKKYDMEETQKYIKVCNSMSSKQ